MGDITNLSYSRISQFNSCQLAFKYSAIDKIKTASQPHYIQLGLCGHRILEFVAKQPTFDGLRNAINTVIGTGEYPYELILEASDYISQWFLPEHFVNEIVGTEVEILYTLAGIDIRGRIDRVDIVGPGHYQLVDYKFSNGQYSETDFVFKLQSHIYVIAGFQMYPDANHITFSYINVKDGSTASDNYFRDDLDEIQAHVESLINAILDVVKSKHYEPNVGDGCLYCNFTNICSEYKKYLQVDQGIVGATSPVDVLTAFKEADEKSKYYYKRKDELKPILLSFMESMGKSSIEIGDFLLELTTWKRNGSIYHGIRVSNKENL